MNPKINPLNLTFDDYIFDSSKGSFFHSADSNLLAPMWCDDLVQCGAEPVMPIDFYTDLFQDGLEPHREQEDYKTGEYGAIALELAYSKDKDGNTLKCKAKRTTITQDLSELEHIISTSENMCFLAPFSYAGKQRSNKNARYMYALCIEIDGIVPKSGIEELFYSWQRSVIPLPQPTYIVASGTGIHLYFVFERPVPMYPNVFKQWSALKKYLTYRFWDTYITKLDDDIQYESVNQPFRIAGTKAKNPNVRALVFKTGEKITIEYLNQFVKDEYKVDVIYQSRISLEQAKELYPDWYQNRIIKKQPKGHYTRHQGIYYNWFKKVYTMIDRSGHRYNCLEHLCALAVQCQIPREIVVQHCEILRDKFETLTKQDDNHFTQYDVNCALRTYDNPTDNAYNRKLEVITARTSIPLIRARRNGRTQEQHLRIARFARDVKYEGTGTSWRDGNGRKPKKEIVKQWRLTHPEGRKVDCIRDTGLSKPTVLKWWNEQ